ncbi:MAG: PilN domain-containing protein [Thermoanaerobaculia bacterium]
MIKINLLAEGKRPVVARRAKAPSGGGGRDLGNFMLVAVALVGVLAAGIWWFVVNSRLTRVQNDVVTAQKQVEELQQVIKEVEDYKAKKAELERKIDVINGLKANQRGPVRIMDEVSRALPELLWLTRTDVIGNTISIQGSAYNMSAVASFMDNLDKVEQFSEPILTDAVQRAAGSLRTQVYDFKINLGYSFRPDQPPVTPGTPVKKAPPVKKASKAAPAKASAGQDGE